MTTLNTIVLVYGYASAFCMIGVIVLIVYGYLYNRYQRRKEVRAMRKLLLDDQKEER